MAAAFISHSPRLDDYWRGIVLFGRNAASYKFALAKTLLDLRPAAGQLVPIEDLAAPFAAHICEHLRHAPKQTTAKSSRFLDACSKANAGTITADQLREEAVRLGFNEVIDAFHVVGRHVVPVRFFLDERAGRAGGIRVTEDFSKLLGGVQAANLPSETEARWRLVETAWELGVSRSALSIAHDSETQSLFAIDATNRRRSVTGSRGALNGYQKGRCFYCFGAIAAEGPEPADVDHFFPHTLKSVGFGSVLDGIWNLVLSCRRCNRGQAGKFDCVPTIRLLERLYTRNEYLIGSHHPLREVLLVQTGESTDARRSFLNDFHRRAVTTLLHQWEPSVPVDDAF